MKHIKLGNLDVARIGLGAMGMTGTYGADGWMTPSRSGPSTGRSSSASP